MPRSHTSCSLGAGLRRAGRSRSSSLLSAPVSFATLVFPILAFSILAGAHNVHASADPFALSLGTDSLGTEAERDLGKAWSVYSAMSSEVCHDELLAPSRLVSVDLSFAPVDSSWLYSIDVGAGFLNVPGSVNSDPEDEWWGSVSLTMGKGDIGLGGAWISLTPTLLYNARSPRKPRPA